LQHDRPELEAKYPQATKDVQTHKAFSSRCIAEEWTRWSERFERSRVNVCPSWKRVGTKHAPEAGVALSGSGDPLQTQKVDFVYEVSFPEGSPAPNCGTAADCAVACAGGFRGFVQSTDGSNRIEADPAYWEVSTYFPPETNPFVPPSQYYHAMCDYGPFPGDQFGHWQRSRAYQDASGQWVGEPCCYYAGNIRFFTKLIYSGSIAGAVSWCKSPL
jgi:hypothetical protein